MTLNRPNLFTFIGLVVLALIVGFCRPAQAQEMVPVHDSWETVPFYTPHDSWGTVPLELPTPPKVSTGSAGTPFPAGPVEHTPGVEQWRTLVTLHFPAHQVENALRVMACESGGDPYADNPRSSAAGLYQFLASTWARTPYAAQSPFDPGANIAAAAWLGNSYEAEGRWFWTEWSCQP